MPAMVGSVEEPTGCRNFYKHERTVEYDSNYCYYFWFGIPVWISIRQCVHVIEKKGPLSFRYIRLKPAFGLKAMVPFYWMVWILGIPAFVGVLSFAIPVKPNAPPITPVNRAIRDFSRWCVPVFIPAFVLYRYLRIPSARQKLIRAVALSKLGVHSDPAGWTQAAVQEILPGAGIELGTPQSILQIASNALAIGDHQEALMKARIALALFDESSSGEEAALAEDISSQSLRLLADSAGQMGAEE